MISLKRYLEVGTHPANRADKGPAETERCAALLSAYRTSLGAMGDGGTDACPTLGADLVRSLGRIVEALGSSPGKDAIAGSEIAVRDLLHCWGERTARHYVQKAEEVRDLLVVMARTAESLDHKDDRYARQLDEVTAQLESIADLDDVTRMRASIESSARELKESIAKMTAEGKAVIDHLRVEVSTCQAKLERVEHIASCDTLTGLGSRHWITERIQQRIGSGAPFSIALIDINAFGLVNESYGNLVGDLLLKEFARELRSSCRFSDIVGRWGGDEFIFVLDSCGPEIEAQIARLRRWISKPYHVPGRTGYVNVQLDVSLAFVEHRPGDNLENLLERADSELCLQRRFAKEEKTA